MCKKGKFDDCRYLLLISFCILSFAFLIFSPRLSYAQWAATYGGNDIDGATSIQQTSDGGYIVAGGTKSFGDELFGDIWVLKLDSNGNVQWQKTFGGDFGDVATSIQQTTDSGYIVTGWRETSSNASSRDIWVLKLDSNGAIQWQKTYGGGRRDEATSIQQATDGGFIVAGGTESFGAGDSDAWVLKLDSDGNVEWQKTYEEIPPVPLPQFFSSEVASSVQQTSDDGYIVAGDIRSSFLPGNRNFWVLKLDSNGNIKWQKSYGGDFEDFARSIRQTGDNGYIVAGVTESFRPGIFDDDLWVLKLDPDGNIEWQKTYGGRVSEEESFSIRQTNDGGYIVAGAISFTRDGSGAWVLKLDSSGNVEWQKTYESVGARSVQQTVDGGYIATGTGRPSLIEPGNFADASVLKLQPDGTIHEHPSCDFVGETNILGIDSSATVTNTNAIATDTIVIPQDTSVTARDTNASRNALCPVCRCPADLLVCISGKVMKKNTGELLRGKTVILRRIFPKRPMVITKVRTDSIGCYFFTDLEDGIYRMRIARCKGGRAKIVNIAGGRVINNVDFECR